MPHGKSKEGIGTVSCKIERHYIKKLDELTKMNHYKSRSDMLREIICTYVEICHHVEGSSE